MFADNGFGAIVNNASRNTAETCEASDVAPPGTRLRPSSGCSGRRGTRVRQDHVEGVDLAAGAEHITFHLGTVAPLECALIPVGVYSPS